MTASASTFEATKTTAVHVGIKYVRWGLSLFIFGLVIGYGPWLHYMHGAVEEVQPAFLRNVTLWSGCPWTLPTYVAQLGSLAMVVFGLCYLVTGRDDRGSGAILGQSGIKQGLQNQLQRA